VQLLQRITACFVERRDVLTAGELLQAERAEGLKNCWQRGVQFADQVKRWVGDENREQVRWVELFNRALQLNSTPLSIAEIFQKQIGSQPRAWIFTSATLAVKQNFSHYQSQMGLLEATTACWDSPFDYDNQAVLYVPQGMPEPNASGYTQAVVEAALPVIKASGGRAFLLCTSLRAMREAAETYRHIATRRPPGSKKRRQHTRSAIRARATC